MHQRPDIFLDEPLEHRPAIGHDGHRPCQIEHIRRQQQRKRGDASRLGADRVPVANQIDAARDRLARGTSTRFADAFRREGAGELDHGSVALHLQQ